MELRVVKEFRDLDIPLQTVRVAWRNAAQAYKTDHPFADERVFLDGKRIILAPDADLSSNVLEVSSRKAPFQLVAGPIFKRSLRMFEFDERTHLAREWWPQGRSTPVVLNPRVAFGAPVVADTRVPTRVLAFFLKTNPIEAVADLFDLSANRVRAAMEYENWLARAA